MFFGEKADFVPCDCADNEEKWLAAIVATWPLTSGAPCQ